MKRSPHRTSAGFTLIELIVVIAAIGILLAIMLPSITGAIDWGKRTQAASNMRQITLAWAMYSQDHEGFLPSSNNYTLNGQPPWVLKPNGTTREAREAAIRGGALYPYINNMDVYGDPGHIFPTYLNAYAINGFLNGEWARTAGQLAPGGSGVVHYDRVSGGTVVLIPEADARNYNINSFIMDPVNDNWIDRVAGNYGGDNLAFADGHSEFIRWRDPRTLQNLNAHGWRTPGSVDCDYLETVFFPR